MAVAPNKLSGIVGPFKVAGYNEKTRLVTFEKYPAIILKASVKDIPKIGYNYAFRMSGRTEASDIYLLTVDIVIHTNDSVLMIKRKNNPFAGKWALPGGFVDPGETFKKAALRELKEETGLTLSKISNIQYVGKYDKINRDPRMKHCISFAFSCYVDDSAKKRIRAGDDASATIWMKKNKIKTLGMAFDHKEIIKDSGVLG